MIKYRKKPVVIEAMQVRENAGGEECLMLSLFCGEALEVAFDCDYFGTIKTLEGLMRVNWGDYIIKGIKGEMYPCKPDIFEATYERVE